nr:MAG TPA: major capsid protein [Microviridae sp.]
MNRNTESHFALNPTNIDIPRSKFDMSHQYKTTFNAGLLIPLGEPLECLPGDTFQVGAGMACRMQPLVHPPLDNMYLDVYFFAVPLRLLWEHFPEFMGENRTGKWTQVTEYETPITKAPAGGWQQDTIADYFTIPTKTANIEVNSFALRAYCLIWNEWFRDQNLQDPANFETNDTTVIGSNGSTYQTDAIKGGKPLPVSKYHDYFTSALPEPQKGPDVLLPLGSSAPVYGTGKALDFTDGNLKGPFNLRTMSVTGLDGRSESDAGFYDTTKTLDSWQTVGLATKDQVSSPNLYADLANATAATVNQFRLAYQTQRLYEKDARGGTRLTELIKSHFGVTSPDARMQRPEYLGGKRIPITVNEVIQTSSTTEISQQGNVAGYSLTNDKSESIFVKSFTEHCLIIGLACVRYDHTYQQGLSRQFSRRRRFDYYWPALANIGEVGIKNKEIYAQGTTKDDEVFGYQEAWAEYRYRNSRVTGQFRTNADGTLDSWHFADYYDALPTLGSTWIQENKDNIDRVLSVNSSVADQFIADFYFNITATRPMPMYSVPGLSDHN